MGQGRHWSQNEIMTETALGICGVVTGIITALWSGPAIRNIVCTCPHTAGWVVRVIVPACPLRDASARFAGHLTRVDFDGPRKMMKATMFHPPGSHQSNALTRLEVR